MVRFPKTNGPLSECPRCAESRNTGDVGYSTDQTWSGRQVHGDSDRQVVRESTGDRPDRFEWRLACACSRTTPGNGYNIDHDSKTVDMQVEQFEWTRPWKHRDTSIAEQRQRRWPRPHDYYWLVVGPARAARCGCSSSKTWIRLNDAEESKLRRFQRPGPGGPTMVSAIPLSPQDGRGCSCSAAPRRFAVASSSPKR